MYIINGVKYILIQGSAARVELATQFQALSELPGVSEVITSNSPSVPSGRLLTLMKQVFYAYITLIDYYGIRL